MQTKYPWLVFYRYIHEIQNQMYGWVLLRQYKRWSSDKNWVKVITDAATHVENLIIKSAWATPYWKQHPYNEISGTVEDGRFMKFTLMLNGVIGLIKRLYLAKPPWFCLHYKRHCVTKTSIFKILEIYCIKVCVLINMSLNPKLQTLCFRRGIKLIRIVNINVLNACTTALLLLALGQSYPKFKLLNNKSSIIQYIVEKKSKTRMNVIFNRSCFLDLGCNTALRWMILKHLISVYYKR